MYVIIEGIDTAGKSTQLEILEKKYPEAIFTKEPGGTKVGQKIRKMVLEGEAKSKVAEMFLFLADRAEHSYEVVKKHPDNIIISDRGFLSGIAYAKTAPEELEYRLSQKEQDSIEKRGSEYLLNIQKRMVDAINMINSMGSKQIELLIIDATKSINEIEEEIQAFLEQ